MASAPLRAQLKAIDQVTPLQHCVQAAPPAPTLAGADRHNVPGRMHSRPVGNVGIGTAAHLREERRDLVWQALRGRRPTPRRWLELASCCIGTLLILCDGETGRVRAGALVAETPGAALPAALSDAFGGSSDGV